MAVERMTLAEIKARGVTINRALVDATTEADIERHRIEDDIEAGVTEPDVTAIRVRLGMTEQDFADAIGVPVLAVRAWGEHRETLDPAARALLLVLDREPQAALRALAY